MQTLVLPDVDPEALTLLLSLLYTGQVTVPSSCLLGKFKEACSLLRVELPQELLGADEVANAPDQPSQVLYFIPVLLNFGKIIAKMKCLFTCLAGFAKKNVADFLLIFF